MRSLVCYLTPCYCLKATIRSYCIDCIYFTHLFFIHLLTYLLQTYSLKYGTLLGRQLLSFSFFFFFFGGGGIQIYKHFNSGLIVNPLMKTTTMGTVKVYWLIDLIRLINSIILCKHWRCDLSVDHFSERENHTFLTEKT